MQKIVYETDSKEDATHKDVKSGFRVIYYVDQITICHYGRECMEKKDRCFPTADK